MTINVTINGHQWVGEQEAGRVGALAKLRIRKDSKKAREIISLREEESGVFVATDLVVNANGEVTEITTEIKRPEIKGIIPGFAEKHAASVRKAQSLGGRK